MSIDDYCNHRITKRVDDCSCGLPSFHQAVLQVTANHILSFPANAVPTRTASEGHIYALDTQQPSTTIKGLIRH